MSSGSITDGAQDFIGAKTFQAGSSASQHNSAGIINIQTAAAGTGADTTEDTLYTYALPANALSAVGKSVRVRVWGSTAANGDNKTAKLYFGATAFSSGAAAANAKDWYLEALVTKTAANTQTACFNGTFNGTALATQVSAPAETDSAAITIKATGANGTAAANDLTARCFIVEFLN